MSLRRPACMCGRDGRTKRLPGALVAHVLRRRGSASCIRLACHARPEYTSYSSLRHSRRFPSLRWKSPSSDGSISLNF